MLEIIGKITDTFRLLGSLLILLVAINHLKWAKEAKTTEGILANALVGIGLVLVAMFIKP